VNTTTLIQLVLGAFGMSGVVGAVVALLKLRPEVNSAAVTQSQGAVTTMQMLMDEQRADRDSWRARALAAEAELDQLRQREAER
jgi:hypothetical protein